MFWLAQNIPLLLDADALNLIASHLHLASLVISCNAETVITPHADEAARLLDVSSEHTQQNRTESALKLAKSLNAICAHHGGSWFVNTTGMLGLPAVAQVTYLAASSAA